MRGELVDAEQLTCLGNSTTRALQCSGAASRSPPPSNPGQALADHIAAFHDAQAAEAALDAEATPTPVADDAAEAAMGLLWALARPSPSTTRTGNDYASHPSHHRSVEANWRSGEQGYVVHRCRISTASLALPSSSC